MKYQYEPLGDEYQFQTFLKDLFNSIYKTNSFEEYGSRGHTQFGVDIYSPELKIAVQAKKKDINRAKKILLRELTSDLTSTTKLIEKFPHDINCVYFATTTSKFIEIQDACISYSLSKGRKIKFFSWPDIQEEISKFPSVRNKYFPALKENNLIDDNISSEIKDRLAHLEKLLLAQNATVLSKKKEYRNIPSCEILLPPVDLEAQKLLMVFILKTAAYQSFADVQYRKFICLLNFSHSFTQFSDGNSGPGFSIISGEVIFLGNCTRLVKMLQNNGEKFWHLFEQFQEDSAYNKINFRMELIPTEGLISYEFEIDGQTRFYNLRNVEPGPLDYEKLDSLNAVLPFIASTTKGAIHLIDLDKIKNYPAFTKFIYSSILEDAFKPSHLKVNINDFDDWDYYYPTPVAD
ncbi:hypothetical protein [Pedobacter nutrimenti]|uniref:hypothetical protein n=1 Tax=Pedobacter nutrimenti TaxID=1241337 RepID=UPI00292D6E4A|nr:hypothetical protein [Pedobacter nutrimenti]